MTTNKELLLTDEEIDAGNFHYYGESVVSEDNWNMKELLTAQLKKATDYYEPLIEKARKEGNSGLEKWESPNYPSGQLENAFILAEKFRALEKAPSIRVDHFLLAVLLDIYPVIARDVLKVFENVKDNWQKLIEEGG